VTLHGGKLEGGFVLVHTGKRSANPSQRKRWLLIKHRDEHDDRSWDIDKPELERSILSGRTLEEIAAGLPSKKPNKRAA
jgi:bifunctional non-homologous end joining protein LigD